MARENKIYLVTHAQLSPGYQTAQTAHVIAEWAIKNPEKAQQWDVTSGSLIVLEAPDAEALSDLTEQAQELKIPFTIFREPDIGDEITAVLFEPGAETVRLLANLPCAGKHVHNQKQLRDIENRKRAQINKMVATEQTKGQNILQHGRSVREHYFGLVEHLKGNIDLSQYDNWKLPEYLNTYSKQILEHLPSNYVMDRYLTLHDCGKPQVLEYDDEGRKHFPGHAEASEKVYREVFSNNTETDERIAQMIRDDMEVHLLKAVDVPEFIKNPNAIGHLIAGLAELTSNASMFGGIESTGFKMKYKHHVQRANAICKQLFDEN